MLHSPFLSALESILLHGHEVSCYNQPLDLQQRDIELMTARVRTRFYPALADVPQDGRGVLLQPAVSLVLHPHHPQ